MYSLTIVCLNYMIFLFIPPKSKEFHFFITGIMNILANKKSSVICHNKDQYLYIVSARKTEHGFPMMFVIKKKYVRVAKSFPN